MHTSNTGAQTPPKHVDAATVPSATHSPEPPADPAALRALFYGGGLPAAPVERAAGPADVAHPSTSPANASSWDSEVGSSRDGPEHCRMGRMYPNLHRGIRLPPSCSVARRAAPGVGEVDRNRLRWVLAASATRPSLAKQ